MRRIVTYPTKRRCVQAVRDGASMRSVARNEGLDYRNVRRWCVEAGVRSQGKPGRPRTLRIAA